MKNYIVLLFALTLCSFASDTNKYPQNYFRSPVGYPIRLSGTFGELRTNHFHAGIDIKSKEGKIGDPLYAIADGYVSRIKVQAGGYGQVLYIAHPNGYTSVYAHMEIFDSAVAQFVKEQQYAKQTFAQDLYPAPNQFTFTKGQTIGKMGTTGRSFGPHLHFEIRDTKTQKPINPLLFNFPMKDTRAPKMHQIKVYNLNDKIEIQNSKTIDLSKKGGNKYGIVGDTLSIGAWRAGLALKVYDHHDNVSNWNGIYSLKMYVDDSLSYQFKMETFDFDETRYLNAHLDYEDLKTKKAYFNRCYKMPGSQLSNYTDLVNDGVVKLYENKATKIKMVADDVDGNTATLVFWVKRKAIKEPKPVVFNYILPYNEENIIDNGSVYLHLEEGALYENLYFLYGSNYDASTGYYSAAYNLHNYKTPVHKYFELGIAPSRAMTDEEMKKAFIAYCDKDGDVQNCGGKWRDGKLYTKVRDLGDYAIMLDQTPPTIKPIRFQNNMQGWKRMTFKITDNYPSGGKAAGLSFKGLVDGEWKLFEYDAKNDLLICKFDDSISRGEHTLHLEVKDNRGNLTVYNRKFLY